MSIDYLVQEEDGVSRFLLEDASGAILLESSDGAEAPEEGILRRIIELTLVTKIV